MAKPRPTEIRLVAKLLDPDAENSEDASALAIEIIEALDNSRLKRESFIVVAEKFFPHLSAPGPDVGGKGAIARLENPDDLLKRIGAL